MFTGIVEEIGKVGLIQPNRLTVKAAKVLEGMEIGSQYCRQWHLSDGDRF